MSGRWLVDGRVLQDRSAVRGIGTYLRGLLGGMADMGVASNVDLVLRRGEPAPPEVGTLGVGQGPRLRVLRRRVQPVADHLLMAAALRRSRPALFHAVEYAQPLISRTPVVVTVHDLIPFLFGDAYRWMARERRIALALLRRADAVITPSQFTADDVVRVAHVAPDRITVVPHGIAAWLQPTPPERADAIRARYTDGAPYLLSVGVFDPHKRLDLLLDTMSRVRARNPGLRLVVVGDQGVYDRRVRDSVAAAGLGDTVVLAGYVDRDDLVALYGGAECTVLSSAYEGFGLPVLESMACGTPVVACAVAAIPEAGGGAAVLVADGDAGAMADAVCALAGDPAERAQRSRAGLEHARTFTWRRAAEATVAVYRSVGG